ncbi:MAG TPA: ATP-binding protein [Actinophytocola sp.]|nr:ATP-binding protein [Actinophytocola sp.]
MSDDPFDTARLRDAVLSSWRSSPTRFREDANAEEDLYLGGYRDRLLVELAQNAADAAGHGGRLRVSVVDRELRVANTGTPLDRDGVASLASLRASAKRHGVGQFGVGFAAVLTVSDAPRVVSRTGGVAFSAERTRRAAEVTGRVPVLRLAWPTDEAPPDDFDTEVRLPLRDDVDPAALLAEFATQAVDLLLSLDGLTRIELGDQAWYRDGDPDAGEIHGPDGVTRWVTVRDSGELPADVTIGAEQRPHWTICWAYAESRTEHQVLHAPTPTDERLSLPARLIATLPVEPSRRRLLPGPATDTVLDAAIRAYPRLLDHLAPADRTNLVPLPGFPLSEVDDKLRQGVLGALRTTPWLPRPDGDTTAPAAAALLPTDSPALAELLADIVPGLVAAEFAAPEHAAALAALDTRRLHTADVVAAVTGIDRAPVWWHRLYDALAPLAEVDADAREALGALPVPMVDGRTIPGPRGALLIDDLGDLALGNAVHPDAAHPLLERLGARRGGAHDLLDSLRDDVERSLDDAESGLDTAELRETVRTLVDATGARPGERPWLAALALRDTAGDWRRADELALPDSPLLDLLDQDTPLGVLDPDTASHWPRTVLTAIGVLDTFAVVVDESPAGPDHDLADEPEWWETLPEPPHRMTAVRDLDLVADDAWPAALALLAASPETWQALHEPRGYTGWWIGRHALLDGRPPRSLRMPDADVLAGLYDPAPPEVAPSVLRAIGVRDRLDIADAADAEELLERLTDPERTVTTGAAMRAHATLAEAVRDGVVAADEVEAPVTVRALTGAVLPAAEGVVLDAPWVLGVLEAERVVSAGLDFDLAEPLADLLDLPLATEVVVGAVRERAEPVAWTDLGAVVDACDLAGVPVPPGGPLVHERLTVRIGLADHEVTWWVDGAVVHCTDTTAGMARALAWATARWADRHTFAALLDDPESLLG